MVETQRLTDTLENVSVSVTNNFIFITMNFLLQMHNQLVSDREWTTKEMIKFHKDSNEWQFQYGTFLQICSTLFDVRTELKEKYDLDLFERA